MFFRKKKKLVLNLVDELKKRPDQMYVCDGFVAVYVPALDKAIFIYGNFTHLSDQELNDFLVAKVNAAFASMN